MSKDDREQLIQYIRGMLFIPAGRYLYYAGRPAKFYNNCYCLKAEEDTREEWAALMQRAMSALMTGGGIGVDFSALRPKGKLLSRTGGISSGPIPLMHVLNETGRNVQQGGSRRSAVWAGLNWKHEDINDFLTSKDWSELIKICKSQDYNFPAPLDGTNISVLWDTEFFDGVGEGNIPKLWYESVEKMCKTGEPGHCYNFGDQENETLRNACTEFISDRDSDVCNLGSVNLARIETKEQLKDVVNLASKFLVCGTIRAELPYAKVHQVRHEYRKIGLGLMGIHEWLLKRNLPYEVNDELKEWLEVYRAESEKSATEHAERFYLARPKKFRAIAPAGTIGILAATTTGIEPLYSVAYKRRYLEGSKWKYQFVIDPIAARIISEYGSAADRIETALSLSREPERRIKFQYDIQKYVDMGISSTINLPAWGSDYNNPDTAARLSSILLRYCHGLRGITAYPDGSRGGQPLEEVSYEEALAHKGTIYDESEDRCISGVCGI
jgi:ribonucleoside-diphosphate reductase alpha chain